MLTRIITGVVAIGIFVPVCIFSHTWVFPIVIGLLCGIGVYEMAKCLKFDKKWFLTIPMYIVAVGLPILRRAVKYNSVFFSYAMFALFGLLIYFLTYTMLKKHKYNVSDIVTLYALCVYVICCFSSMVIIRDSGSNAKYIYLLAFLGAWVCDTFAYFVGKFFGKHKLIPEISPKKTIEGSIGGIVFTIISFAIYCLIIDSIYGVNIGYLRVCVLGLILPIVSQIGDLIASTIKRQYDIKDYGSLFPGHGGVLDRFDSVMLTAPALYFVNVIFNLFY